MGRALLCKRRLILEEHDRQVRTTCYIVSDRMDALTHHRPAPFCSVNGGTPVWVDQPSTGGGHVIISVPVQLHLNSGSNNITFSAGQTSESRPHQFRPRPPPAHPLTLPARACSVHRLRCGPRQDHRLLIPCPVL